MHGGDELEAHNTTPSRQKSQELSSTLAPMAVDNPPFVARLDARLDAPSVDTDSARPRTPVGPIPQLQSSEQAILGDPIASASQNVYMGPTSTPGDRPSPSIEKVDTPTFIDSGAAHPDGHSAVPRLAHPDPFPSPHTVYPGDVAGISSAPQLRPDGAPGSIPLAQPAHNSLYQSVASAQDMSEQSRAFQLQPGGFHRAQDQPLPSPGPIGQGAAHSSRSPVDVLSGPKSRVSESHPSSVSDSSSHSGSITSYTSGSSISSVSTGSSLSRLGEKLSDGMPTLAAYANSHTGIQSQKSLDGQRKNSESHLDIRAHGMHPPQEAHNHFSVSSNTHPYDQHNRRRSGFMAPPQSQPHTQELGGFNNPFGANNSQEDVTIGKQSQHPQQLSFHQGPAPVLPPLNSLERFRQRSMPHPLETGRSDTLPPLPGFHHGASTSSPLPPSRAERHSMPIMSFEKVGSSGMQSGMYPSPGGYNIPVYIPSLNQGSGGEAAKDSSISVPVPAAAATTPGLLPGSVTASVAGNGVEGQGIPTSAPVWSQSNVGVSSQAMNDGQDRSPRSSVNSIHSEYGRSDVSTEGSPHISTSGGIGASDRPYRCPYKDCERSFARSSDQRRHVRSHEKPLLQCPYWDIDPSCHRNGGAFNRLDVLKRHLKLVHYVQPNQRDSGWCKMCHKPFANIKDFIDHTTACAIGLRAKVEAGGGPGFSNRDSAPPYSSSSRLEAIDLSLQSQMLQDAQGQPHNFIQSTAANPGHLHNPAPSSNASAIPPATSGRSPASELDDQSATI